MERVKSETRTPYMTRVERVDSKQEQTTVNRRYQHDTALGSVLRSHPTSVGWYATVTSCPFAPLTAPKQDHVSNALTEGFGKGPFL
ncbi:uncharacterized protein PG986_013829 [Apiospora aurea]|uniref:Uncharacterized protein n=1 Tax=Apiospora aurea TaxID=335848 RepID=A0ABR1PWN0_9PEZI